MAHGLAVAWRPLAVVVAGMLAAFAGGFAGCSAGNDSFGGDDDDGQGASGAHATTTNVGGFGGSLFDGGVGASGGSEPACSTASQFVYVIDENNRLYRFDPTIASPSAFSLVGTLSCGSSGGPNSMAVSRDGFAYVLYGEDDAWYPDVYHCHGVHRVDINTAECFEAIPFSCGSQGFDKFGMGYATDGADTTTETLYLGNSLQASLASLDTTTGALHVIGSLPNQGPEFTGNAVGELWGFFPYESPPAAIQLDKSYGTAQQTLPLGSLPDISYGLRAAWAFAYWGGSFYIFYMVDPPDSSSKVYKLEYDGSVSTYISNTGLVIVGAGVSTCAPIAPPT